MGKNSFTEEEVVKDLSEIDCDNNQVIVMYKDKDNKIHYRKANIVVPNKITTEDDLNSIAEAAETLSLQADTFLKEKLAESIVNKKSKRRGSKSDAKTEGKSQKTSE